MEVREYLRKIGAKGGAKGGPARAKTLTPEERSRIAAMGAAAREARKQARRGK